MCAALCACATSAERPRPSGEPRAPSPVTVPVGHDYLPGLRAHPHVPEGVTSAPVVVMVPGGSWQSADPRGLQPLAAALAERGILAMPVVIRASRDGVTWPTPVEDILCALADGAATAREEGIDPGPVVLLGHSSGAHLSSVAALAPERFTPDCEDEAVEPDGVVGLAGPYDISRFADHAAVLFGNDAGVVEDRLWDAANPVLLAPLHPEVPALLLHGSSDDVVPDDFSTDFATALEDAGHATTVEVLDHVDHDAVYWPDVAAEPVARWLDTITPPPAPD